MAWDAGEKILEIYSKKFEIFKKKDASPVTLALGIKKEDLMPVKKEGVDISSHP